MVERLAYTHMVDECLPPLRVLLLTESEAGAGKYELVIVVVEAETV